MNKLSVMLLHAVLFILFIALAAVNCWGSCYTTDIVINNNYPCEGPGVVRPNYVETVNEQCANYDINASCGAGKGIINECPVCKEYLGSAYVRRTCCATPCEADSLKCISVGGTWTNTGASTCDGKSCKMSNCLQSDTLWLNDSKAACDAIGGENNYAITDIDETCVHSGICCPPDSALVGNTCKWRCDSLYTACTAKNGYLYAGVLQDTTISGSDSTFTNKCYYNCSYAYNKDSTTSVTEGNTACSSPSTPIADCTRMPNDFSSVRTTYGDSVYSYDFLTPGSAAYIDSIVLTPCSRFMYRCTVNGKYKYWYSDADIPTGCTNIVKIK